MRSVALLSISVRKSCASSASGPSVSTASGQKHGYKTWLCRTDCSDSVNVAGGNVLFSDSVKLLGVTLGSTLSFHKHVSNVARSCYFHNARTETD